MPNNQLWFHGRVTGLNPKGEPVTDEVPFSSISEQWLRNQLAEKSAYLIRTYGFRHQAQEDPNTTVLLHPSKECISYILSVDPCLDGNPDCQGDCQTRAQEETVPEASR